MIVFNPKLNISTIIEKPRSIVVVSDVDGVASKTLQHNFIATLQTHRKMRIPSLINMPLSEGLLKYREVYDQSNSFENLLVSLGCPSERADEYNKLWMGIYTRLIYKSPPDEVPGFKQRFEFLKSIGVELHLVSSAKSENLDIQLGNDWISNTFGTGIHLGGDKTQLLIDIKADSENKLVVYLGDAVSDGTAALEAKVFFGAMIHEFSHNTPKQLLDFFFRHPDQVIPIHSFQDLELILVLLERRVYI